MRDLRAIGVLRRLEECGLHRVLTDVEHDSDQITHDLYKKIAPFVAPHAIVASNIVGALDVTNARAQVASTSAMMSAS